MVPNAADPDMIPIAAAARDPAQKRITLFKDRSDPGPRRPSRNFIPFGAADAIAAAVASNHAAVSCRN